MKQTIDDLVFNTRQQRQRIDEAEAEYNAVAELRLPESGDSDAVFRERAEVALVALARLAVKQHGVLKAITRLPEYSSDEGGGK